MATTLEQKIKVIDALYKQDNDGRTGLMAVVQNARNQLVDSIMTVATLDEQKLKVIKSLTIAGLDVGADKTDDKKKKNAVRFLKEAVNYSEDETTLTKALKTSARVFSHHTNFFKLRFITKDNTNAYQATKIYFDASKTLLGINDNDWNKVLTEQRNNSNKNEYVTYAEVLKMLEKYPDLYIKPEEIQPNLYIS